MVLNNRGQAVFLLFMLGVVVIILALAFAFPLKQFVDDARANSTDTAVGLGCDNASISDFNKAQCAITDISLPYFIIGMIALAGIIVGAKLLLGGAG